jgi:MscS family membrane protein
VLLVLPVLPLTRFSQLFIDEYVNFTGLPLVVITYLFFIAYFIAASFLCFYLFEALGRSLSEALVGLRGGGSDLQLRRVSNLVMPVGRVCGGLLVLALIYRLLIVLGLPSSTVLAFSAVPGLAIGLGASKLLGNLFAGLSIQTDRPVRVGEFCRIGDNLGFVTKIGLRSLELQTLESRITIPNSIADEQTIVNYSRRSPDSAAAPMQSLDVHLAIEQRLSPEQVDDLLAIVRAHVESVPELLEPLVTLEQSDVDQLTLICFAMVSLHDWATYLAVREQLLRRLQQLVEQVRLSTFTIGVSYETRADQLERLPSLLRGVVNSDPQLDLQSCRLMAIADFTYNIVVRLHGHQDSLRAFKDAIHALNQRLLVCFAQEGIEIPFPTQLQLQRDV